MRKILFIILIILLTVGAGFIVVKGFGLGNFQVWGVKEIIAQNKNIEDKNLELSNLVSISYPKAIQELETSSQVLTSTKKDYEDKSILISNNRYYMQTEKYEIEYLWTKLGNYAKDNNVQIKIDVVNSGTAKLYDLKFTIAGAYADVTEFIYDIENDSKLGFKIEEFNMSAVKEGVQGSFICKEININIEEIDETEQKDEQVEEPEVETESQTAIKNKKTETENKENDAQKEETVEETVEAQ